MFTSIAALRKSTAMSSLVDTLQRALGLENDSPTPIPIPIVAKTNNQADMDWVLGNPNVHVRVGGVLDHVRKSLALPGNTSERDTLNELIGQVRAGISLKRGVETALAHYPAEHQVLASKIGLTIEPQPAAASSAPATEPVPGPPAREPHATAVALKAKLDEFAASCKADFDLKVTYDFAASEDTAKGGQVDLGLYIKFDTKTPYRDFVGLVAPVKAQA